MEEVEVKCGTEKDRTLKKKKQKTSVGWTTIFGVDNSGQAYVQRQVQGNEPDAP